VALTDAEPERVPGAMEQIRRAFEKGIARGKVTAAQRDAALARIRAAGDLADAVNGATFIIEAIPENLPLKQALFEELDQLAADDAVLATNTSSLPVGQIARATERPGSVVGTHFFNPVPAMKLVEVIRAEATTDETVDRATEFARSLGKEPIVVRDMPGFATSRLGIVLGLEAIRMVEQEVASPADIDRAMELGYNHPVGPLRLGDLVGLDVRLAIADHLYQTLGGDTYRAPELLRRMVAEGRLGRKSGEGFYQWPT
jgi:3-hydroxybutyryl-CoA dehydrogenase